MKKGNEIKVLSDLYIAPRVEILNLCSQGLLCTSTKSTSESFGDEENYAGSILIDY